MTEPVLIDARGLRCPLPVISLARRAQGLAPGTVLTLLATDPAARQDVAAWARLRGHEMLTAEHEAPDLWRLTVRLGHASP